MYPAIFYIFSGYKPLALNTNEEIHIYLIKLNSSKQIWDIHSSSFDKNPSSFSYFIYYILQICLEPALQVGLTCNLIYPQTPKSLCNLFITNHAFCNFTVNLMLLVIVKSVLQNDKYNLILEQVTRIFQWGQCKLYWLFYEFLFVWIYISGQIYIFLYKGIDRGFILDT